MRNAQKISAMALLIAVPMLASAQACCPGDGNGVQSKALSATSGLGQSTPDALNLSASPDWQVYQFNRNGMRYFQVNDAMGRVHAAVAVANGVMMVLPVGADDVQQTVDLPTGLLPVYQDSFIAIVPVQLPDGTIRWLIQSKL